MSFKQEKEINEPYFECDSKGDLNENAIGYSRLPIITCNVKGSPFRKKKWNYWCFLAEDFMFSLNLANVDYLGLASGQFLDLKSKEFVEFTDIKIFGKDCKLGETVEENISYSGKKINFSIEYEGSEKILVKCDCPSMQGKLIKADLKISKNKEHESLNVVIPWSKKRYQFTSKQNTMPIEGNVVVDDKTFTFNPKTSFAVLDFGRGKWPYRTDWNWGSFSGYQGNDLIGINLGAGWTDGTESTENGLYINGKLYKISDDVKVEFDKSNVMNEWRAKTVHTDDLDITLKPEFDRAFSLNLGILSMAGHQCFGWGSGIIKAAGRTYKLEKIHGWIEDCHYKW